MFYNLGKEHAKKSGENQNGKTNSNKMETDKREKIGEPGEYNLRGGKNSAQGREFKKKEKKEEEKREKEKGEKKGKEKRREKGKRKVKKGGKGRKNCIKRKRNIIILLY